MATDHAPVIRSVARLLIAAILIYGLTTILLPFAFPIIVGGIITTLSRPYYTHLLKIVRYPSLAAFITLLTVILLIVLPLSAVFALLIKEISSFSSSLSDGSLSIASINHYITTVTDSLGFTVNPNIQEYAQKALAFVGDKSVLVVGSVLGALASLFLTLLTTYYLLQNQDQFHKVISDFSPLSKTDTEQIFNRTKQVVQATVRGNLVLIALQAIVSSLGFLVFGISSPLLLGSLYGLSSLIPGVGSALIWVPVAVFQFLQGNIIGAIGIACWSVAQIILLDNFIGPRLIENKAQLHPFLILLGVLGGVAQFGLVGVILGPTIIALGIVGLEILSRTWQSHPE